MVEGRAQSRSKFRVRQMASLETFLGLRMFLRLSGRVGWMEGIIVETYT